MEGPVIIYAGLLLFGLVKTARVVAAAFDPLDYDEELRRIDVVLHRIYELCLGIGATIFGAGLLANHMGIMT